MELARALLQFSAIATAFCGSEFTIAALREVYEAVWGVVLDKPNFHRKAPALLDHRDHEHLHHRPAGDHTRSGPRHSQTLVQEPDRTARISFEPQLPGISF
ncbi:NrtR DNA-binding winged helix domain-containing protein [Amycolatopsis keratiniphila]|uniref:NrtR DNA-binding winged helix domain-containing protein n=1 Tax=Amycolatopsis keratiniphila TaxID=129921 RepID=UPI003F4D102E